jgi:Dolichyl-phosphate-mannose-protein mannosyltransferase
MFAHWNNRAAHWALLLVVTGCLGFVNLGSPGLWDVDEGHNAQAAREMLESGSWIVPTFNFHLRVDKPALLYWFQIAAYRAFGINEFAARLPSALAAVLAVLACYELGRAMYGPVTGLLAGVILTSTVMFCASAHFANPDALLNLFTILTLSAFWYGYSRSTSRWLLPAGITAALAVLAKGPVGLVLPGGVILVFLLYSGHWALLWNRRLVLGCLLFLLMVLPWYVWVGVATHMEFWRGFFLTHNVGRFQASMEGHRGSVFYYPLWLLIGFAPWSVFLGPAVWNAVREWKAPNIAPAGEATAAASQPQTRFLCCWIAVYVVFFSVSATKLPNYILPVYAPLALLTARALNRWRQRTLFLPSWALPVCFGCLALVGIGVGLGLLVAGGTVRLPFIRSQVFPELRIGAVVGALPIAGAILAWWWCRKERADMALASVAATAIALVGSFAAWGAVVVDSYKAARPLSQAYLERLPEPDVRVGCFRYYQPSIVFYSGREVFRFKEAQEALEFLHYPVPVYLFVPSSTWASLEATAPSTARVLAQHWDLYQKCEVSVVTNR